MTIDPNVISQYYYIYSFQMQKVEKLLVLQFQTSEIHLLLYVIGWIISYKFSHYSDWPSILMKSLALIAG